jgi:polar amino acid transport system substrate-binding protein
VQTMKKMIVFISVCAFLCCWCQEALCQDHPTLKASLAFLPDILESPEKGVFVDLVKAIDKEYPGKIEIEVFPFPRSLDNIIAGRADFHMPMIRNKLIPDELLPYRYVSEIMGYVCFVIYSNKANPITLDMLKNAEARDNFPFRVETMRGFKAYFPFPVINSSRVTSSLEKVNLRRADAFIFAQEESDYTVRMLNLKEIHRELYDHFEDVMVIPKGARGDTVDHILSYYIQKLKADGTWQPLHLKVHVPYDDWQPH